MMLLYALAKPGSRPGVSRFIAEAGLFTNTGKQADAAPDLQYLFQAGMTGLAVDPRYEPNFIFNPILIQPQSRGEVRLRSSDPASLPIVQPNYLQAEADVRVLRRGIELSQQLAATAPLCEYWDGGPLFGVPDPMRSDRRVDVPESGADRLDAFIRANATTVWHPSGSCKMGHDAEAVVDAELRVHGIENLRVVDASIMPSMVSGNTSAPTTMIAEKAADLIRASSSSSTRERYLPTDSVDGETKMNDIRYTGVNLVNQLIGVNLRTVEGGFRLISIWAELSAVVYPLAFRVVMLSRHPASNARALETAKAELCEALMELGGLPFRALQDLQAELESLLRSGAAKGRATH